MKFKFFSVALFALLLSWPVFAQVKQVSTTTAQKTGLIKKDSVVKMTLALPFTDTARE